MTRYVRRRSQKLGQSPGSVVFVGEKKTDATRLTLFSYDAQSIEEREITDLGSLPELISKPGNHWLNVDGVHDTEAIQAVGALVDAHPLILEDIVSPGQRAKVDQFDTYSFIVARMLTYHAGESKVDSEQVSLLLRPRLLISFQERPGDVFGPVRDRLRGGTGRMRKLGTDYLAYALLDILVDHYFVVLETFGDQLDELEDAVLDEPSIEVQRRLRSLRGNLILIRRSSWPVRELLGNLSRNDSPHFSEDVRLFLRDAHEHALQVVEVIESLRDVTFGLTDLYMSSLSQRMNDIMKVLTIIGTIFIPLSFVAGLYGMNFDAMPELHWSFGYPYALTIMASIAGGLLLYFRRKRWI